MELASGIAIYCNVTPTPTSSAEIQYIPVARFNIHLEAVL